MENTVLDEKQKNLTKLLKLFKKDFFLVWWTAIALTIKHRKSIDFDLFSFSPINTNKIIKKVLENNYKIEQTLVHNEDELTIIIDWVKLTFLYYPFEAKFEKVKLLEEIDSPDLLYLSAMKAYALWRRGKWKDYVDLYFIIKKYYSTEKISKKAEEIFLWAFNEKLFREQLCFFDDIDYSEKVSYIWEEISDKEIKRYLCDKSI